MKIVTIHHLSPTRVMLLGDFDAKKVDKLLAYYQPGYQHVQAFKRHLWDGKVHLFNKVSNTFAAGLSARVEEHLRTKQKSKVRHTWPIGSQPTVLPVTHTNRFKLNGVDLYPWQKFAVRKAVEARFGVVKVATGGGKSEIMAGVVRSLEVPSSSGGTRPPKTLIIVPNRNLLVQTKARLEERLGIEVGQIGAGKWEEDWVTVALPQTLSRKTYAKMAKSIFHNAELLLFDECQHVASKSWMHIAMKCRASYRLGFSATPFDRADGSNLKVEGATGPVLVEVKASTLIGQGKLARPTVHFIDIREPFVPSDLNWEDVYRFGIVRNRDFHRRIRNLMSLHSNQSTLVLVTRIDHGRKLLERAPPGARFVHGKTDTDTLAEAIHDFKAGKFKTLIASPIFGEGTDLPNIDVLIVADGGKSVIRTLQKIGRALRMKKGRENSATVYDFAHHTHKKLGHHSYLRWQAYVREKFDCVNPPVSLNEDEDE